jgi:hypothetical protein
MQSNTWTWVYWLDLYFVLTYISYEWYLIRAIVRIVISYLMYTSINLNYSLQSVLIVIIDASRYILFVDTFISAMSNIIRASNFYTVLEIKGISDNSSANS